MHRITARRIHLGKPPKVVDLEKEKKNLMRHAKLDSKASRL
jgi:hypothetical protein